MPKKTKTLNAIDLKLNQFVQLGGNDYRITNLGLNARDQVIVVVWPVGAKHLCRKHQDLMELRLIVPQDTPFTVLK
jgi:hypothetical protein